MSFLHCIRLDHSKCSVTHCMIVWGAKITEVLCSRVKYVKKQYFLLYKDSTTSPDRGPQKSENSDLYNTEPLSSQPFYETHRGFVSAIRRPPQCCGHHAPETRCGCDGGFACTRTISQAAGT